MSRSTIFVIDNSVWFKVFMDQKEANIPHDIDIYCKVNFSYCVVPHRAQRSKTHEQATIYVSHPPSHFSSSYHACSRYIWWVDWSCSDIRLGSSSGELIIDSRTVCNFVNFCGCHVVFVQLTLYAISRWAIIEISSLHPAGIYFLLRLPINQQPYQLIPSTSVLLTLPFPPTDSEPNLQSEITQFLFEPDPLEAHASLEHGVGSSRQANDRNSKISRPLQPKQRRQQEIDPV